MPGTTARELPYPLPGDSFSDLDLIVRGLAEKVEQLLPRFASDTALVSGTLSAGGTLGQTFNLPAGRFPTPPKVLGNISGFVTGSNAVLIRTIDQVTATSFRIVLLNTGSGSVTLTNLPVTYVALQLSTTP